MAINLGRTGSDEIRQFRDMLLREKALNEQDKIKAQRAKENIVALFKTIDEEVIQKLEARNIFIRSLLAYDMDRVIEDKEYNSRFIEEFKFILSQIKDLLESERRS